jgi:parvulin-like peptidyl-prolyl isomerase
MKIGLTLPLVAVSLLTPLGWSQTASQTPAAKPAAPAPSASQDPNRVVATINGQKITAKQVEEMLKPFPPEQRKQIDANLSKFVEQLYTRQQLAEAAQKLNLEQQSPWKEQIELNRRGILANAYVAHLSDQAAKETPEDPQKYYDAHKGEFEFAKLSGIFVGFNPPGTPANNNAANVRTEEAAHEKANELEKKLAAGGDFSALARAESEHQSASKGGDLGNWPINDPQVKLPAEIKTAVAKLQPGQVSEPVKLPGIYLIVKLDSREVTPFDKVKSDIEQKLQNERTQNVVKKETEKYAIHVEDQAFFSNGGAATASAPKIPSLQRPATPNQ